MNVTVPHDSAWTAATDTDRLALLMRSLRRNRWLVGSIWGGAVAVAVILALVLPSYWRVEIVVMPVTKSNNVNISTALAGGLSGLAGGLGGLLGRSGSNEDEALAVLRSRELFDVYATKENLVPILYADRWAWADLGSPPTLRQAYKLFDTQIRDVDLDRRTGIVTLSMTWKDRALAARWARDFVALTNQKLRQQAIEEAQSNMQYLDGEIRRASAASAQNALTTALSGAYDRALQDYMFAKGQSEFAFRVIDPPTIPDARERVSPQRKLIVMIGFFAGGMLAFAATYLCDWLRARRGRA